MPPLAERVTLLCFLLHGSVRDAMGELPGTEDAKASELGKFPFHTGVLLLHVDKMVLLTHTK